MICPGSETLRIGSGVAVFPEGNGVAEAMGERAGIVATGSGLHAENPEANNTAQANTGSARL